MLISTFNEDRYIARCLDYVLGQDYHSELMKVWVIDGGSTDATVQIAQTHARNDERVTVIAGDRRLNLPEALNLGIERSSGDLVAKIDAHGYPERDYIRLAARAFDEAGDAVACVGGRPLQHGETPFGHAVAIARTSPFGVGLSEYAGTEDKRWADTVQCGVYRRDALTAVGAFDPAMTYGEDDELNWRLRWEGYRILLDTALRYHYVTRPTWSSAYRQYRNYGRARVAVVAKHHDFLRPYHLVPAACLIGGAGLACLAPFSRAARRGLGALGGGYALAAAAAGVHAARSLEPSHVARVTAAFAAVHSGYASGMIAGLWALLIRRMVPRSAPITRR